MSKTSSLTSPASSNTKRKGSTSHLFDRVCHLFNTPNHASNSFNFHTHHVLYTFPEGKTLPNVRIRKSDVEEVRPLMIRKSSSSCGGVVDGTLLDILDDIFNKLHLTYQDNILEYVKTEQKHRIEQQVGNQAVQIQLFDDDEDQTMTSTDSVPSTDAAGKLAWLEDSDGDEPILRPAATTTKKKASSSVAMDESSSSEEEEETTSSSRGKKKQFAFLEDSDDELEMDRSISANPITDDDENQEDHGENNEEDEEMDSYMKSKAEETQHYIKHTKVRGQPGQSNRKKKRGQEGSSSEAKPSSSSSEQPVKKTDKQKKRKAANEWNKIKGLLKEKEDEKKRKLE